MEDQDVLQHLLEIESQASALVDDAQAEADKRLKQAEEQNRASYEAKYKDLVKELDGEYQSRMETIRAEYQKELDSYRGGLEGMAADGNAFSALARSLLFGGK